MSTLRWALLALTVLTLLVVASLTADSNGWSQDVRWARSRLDRMAASSHTCPVLLGDPLPGDARRTYRQAGRAMLGVPNQLGERLRAALEDRGGDADEALQLAAQLPAEALQKLRDAARTEGSMFWRAAFGTARDWDPLYGLMPLVDGVLVRARFATQPTVRVDEWTVALATGVDLCGHSTAVGKMMGALVVERTVAVADARWLTGLPEAERRRAADALAAAEPTLPVEVDLAPVLVDLVTLVERGNPTAEDLGFANPYQLWQYGFSAWHAGVERVGRAIGQLQAFEAATPTSESWPSRRARLAALQELDERSNPDLFWRYFQVAVDCEQARRECVAGLRELRVALARSLGDEPPQLDDPLR
ncbi:MAG: hypothetical protein ACE37K_08835 [Planctomycetota bacterium]